jgi:hypothetical protein
VTQPVARSTAGGELSKEEDLEIQKLMQQYQQRLLRKAEALGEAVRRGLRSPL